MATTNGTNGTTNGSSTNGIGPFDPTAYPPFPSDIPSVSLETFSLAELEKGADQALQDKLFETCKTRGFFYLDLNGSRASAMQQDCDEIARLAERVFQLPQAEQEKYPMKGSIFGFKPIGASKTDAKGTPDTAVFFNIAKDAILENTDRWPLPDVVLEQKPLLSRYMRTAHSTGLLILSLLATKLGLPADAFANLNRITEESGDHIRLTHGPARKHAELPEIQTPGHTDFGSITLLFNWLGGLQVWSDPSRGGSFENVVDPTTTTTTTTANSGDQPRWLWVRPPPPNHAIVNLADAVVKWTGGALCSGRHRVVPAPGEQGRFSRYSVVYFVRPEDQTVLRRLKAPGIPELGPGEEEQEITAKKWITQQSRALGVTIAN